MRATTIIKVKISSSKIARIIGSVMKRRAIRPSKSGELLNLLFFFFAEGRNSNSCLHCLAQRCQHIFRRLGVGPVGLQLKVFLKLFAGAFGRRNFPRLVIHLRLAHQTDAKLIVGVGVGRVGQCPSERSRPPGPIRRRSPGSPPCLIGFRRHLWIGLAAFVKAAVASGIFFCAP